MSALNWITIILAVSSIGIGALALYTNEQTLRTLRKQRAERQANMRRGEGERSEPTA